MRATRPSRRRLHRPRRGGRAGDNRREDPRRALGATRRGAGGWRTSSASATRSLARNVRTRDGEIDLIVCDGHALVFVEVKTRRARSAGARSGSTERSRWRRCARASERAMRRLARGMAAATRARAPERGDDPLRRDRRDRRSQRAELVRARTPRGRVVAALQRELLVGERLERHPVQRRDALAQDRLAMRRRRVADVLGKAPAGWRASAWCMKRSRVTFATIDAAAIAALVASPSTIARCGCSNSRDREAVEQAHHLAGDARAWRRARASRRAARLVLCSPRASIPRTQRETTTTRAALRGPAGRAPRAPRGRAAWSRSARSAPAARAWSARRSRTARAAATSGPARQPRPASSAPATSGTPRRRSNANSRLPLLARRARRRARADGAGSGCCGAAARRPRRPLITSLEDADAVGRPVGGERPAR